MSSAYKWPGFREEWHRDRAFLRWFWDQPDGKVVRALYNASLFVVLSALALFAVELAFDIGGYTPRWFFFMVVVGWTIFAAAFIAIEDPARRAWDLTMGYRRATA